MGCKDCGMNNGLSYYYYLCFFNYYYLIKNICFAFALFSSKGWSFGPDGDYQTYVETVVDRASQRHARRLHHKIYHLLKDQQWTPA